MLNDDIMLNDNNNISNNNTLPITYSFFIHGYIKELNKGFYTSELVTSISLPDALNTAYNKVKERILKKMNVELDYVVAEDYKIAESWEKIMGIAFYNLTSEDYEVLNGIC